MFKALVCLIIFSSSLAFAHRFHSTMTQVSYHPRYERSEVIIDIFTHDLDDLKQILGSNEKSFEKDLEKYIKEKLVIKSKEKASLEWKLVGIRYGVHHSEIFLEIEKTKPEDLIFVKNQILFEKFSDQLNKVHLVSSQGKSKAFSFSKKLNKEKTASH